MKIKDTFVKCPHGRWISQTVSSKDIDRPISNSCDCFKKTTEFSVIISGKSFERIHLSKVNYWNQLSLRT